MRRHRTPRWMMPFQCPPRALLRFVATLALAIIVSQAVAFPLLRAQPNCTESCPGDTSDHRCPPNCQHCSCCSALRTLPPLHSVAAVSAPAPRRLLSWRTVEALPSPQSGEIFHVPKLVRA